MDIGAAVVAGAETTELMEPRERALDHPASHAQAAAVRRVAAGQYRLNASLAKRFAVRSRMIGSVALHAAGT